jgi:hypothetical protein
MKRLLLIPLLAGLIILPLLAQETDEAEKKEESTDTEQASGSMYHEKTLEDFETTTYTEKNLRFRVTRDQKAGLTMRDQFPAPLEDSKKYLGLKMYGRLGDVLAIIPEKEIIIEKYCKSISMWVYGKRFSGQLSIILQDADKTNHRLILGTLDYLGWRKLTVSLPSDITQQDNFLNQKEFLKIIQIQYRPGNQTRLPKWQYFYIDDITAVVREKYTDRQSDDW